MNQHHLGVDRYRYSYDLYAPNYAMAELSRCSHALFVIARMVGNNMEEPGNTGALPLPPGVTAGLMAAVEIIARHMDTQIEEIQEATESRRKWGEKPPADGASD